MSVRTRKLIGTAVMVIFVTLYVMAAVTVADLRFRDASGLAQALYFFVAGLAWVPPAGLLIRWMQRP